MTSPAVRGLSLATFFLVSACASEPATDPACDAPALQMGEAIDLYLDAWALENPSERACALQRSLDPDVTLLGAGGPIEGRAAVVDALDARIEATHGAGDMRDVEGDVGVRHQEARLAWSSSVESGEEWLELGEDGRLLRIHVLAGAGEGSSPGDALLRWRDAWNADDDAARVSALEDAATEDIRFTDLLTDVQSREALATEIERQRSLFAATLVLDDSVEVFAFDGQAPTLLKIRGRLVLEEGEPLEFIDYVRLRDGRIERLSGFPVAP